MAYGKLKQEKKIPKNCKFIVHEEREFENGPLQCRMLGRIDIAFVFYIIASCSRRFNKSRTQTEHVLQQPIHT